MPVIHSVPIIDISAYLDSSSSQDAKTFVVDEVKAACSRYGFLQVKGHGVPIELQRNVIDCCRTLFALPQEQKDALSLTKSISKRGYERIGEQTLDKKCLPDQKEGFYIGKEVSPEQTRFLYGPNQWPDLPEEVFHGPITTYHEHMFRLCNSLIEILVLGLGHSLEVLETFTKDPVCNIKLLHYPKHLSKDSRQFGAGAHTDFGGITILLQQPEKNGLQVFYEPTNEWLPVPAVEDIFVVNLGDLIGEWTGGIYKSTLHRVINVADGDRYSVPCFWHGDMTATNPFKPQNNCGETVEDHVRRKFNTSYGTKS